jgi:hypothetical protein
MQKEDGERNGKRGRRPCPSLSGPRVGNIHTEKRDYKIPLHPFENTFAFSTLPFFLVVFSNFTLSN